MKNWIGRNQIKAFILCAAVAGASLLFPRQSAASDPLKLLEATGVLVGIDDRTAPDVVTLNVDGKEASGPLHEDCVFFDERERVISREVFVRAYTRKVVTVEIYEDTGQVLACRAGS